MATTTPYGIYYPVASDSVAPLHTAFSTLADSVNTAMTNSIGAVVAKQQNAAYTVATEPARAAIVSPPTGATCFVSGTQSSYVYNGTKWVPAYIPWTAYTPLAITGFTISAKYTVSNNMVTVYATLLKNATATSATTLSLSLPLDSDALTSGRMPIGSGTLFDASTTTTFSLSVWPDGVDKARVLYQNANPVKLTNINPSPSSSTPATLTNNDVISLNFTYPLP
jgi:hypothetical protein